MINIKVKKDLWQHLAESDKPVVMYGMGNGADKILAVCEKKGIEIKDFFASDGFVRGHSFHGKKVLSYSETKEKYGEGNFIVLLSFASSLPEVIDNIKRIANESELYAPDVPVCGCDLFDTDYFISHETEIVEARKLFADKQSVKVFDNVIKYKLTGRIDYLFDSDSEVDETFREILHAKEFECTADLGAYNGDTARQLAEYAPKLKKIYAFEPDRRNFRKLSEYAEREERFEVLPFQLAAWSKQETLTFGAEGNRNSGVGGSTNAVTSKCVTVEGSSLDNIVSQSGDKIDYIKFDVEGAESEAIDGCINTINAHSPALLVSVYHRSEDIFALSLKIHALFPDYKLYLRKFRYIPAWDLNLYGVNNGNKKTPSPEGLTVIRN